MSKELNYGDYSTIRFNSAFISIYKFLLNKEHEFNPTHSHSGAFSFVIWVKIPFDYKEEQKVYPSVNECETAAFYFSYISPLGGQDVHYINLDSDWEWSMIFFPARMYHGVNPFYTSDEQRISISGNVYAK